MSGKSDGAMQATGTGAAAGTGGANPLQSLVNLLGVDPESQRRTKMASMLGTGLSGLAGVVGSLHPRYGAELQNKYMGQAAEHAQLGQTQKKQGVDSLLSLYKTLFSDDSKTAEEKNWQLAQKDPAFAEAHGYTMSPELKALEKQFYGNLGTKLGGGQAPAQQAPGAPTPMQQGAQMAQNDVVYDVWGKQIKAR